MSKINQNYLYITSKNTDRTRDTTLSILYKLLQLLRLEDRDNFAQYYPTSI